VTVRFVAASGRAQAIEAFWDGDGVWRARVCADEAGEWRWTTMCSNAADVGLHGRRGRFECVAYDGDNPRYLHGPLRLAADRFRFECADGTPFFWLGDTAWNGGLRADAADWARYLDTRRAQGFNVIQLVTTQWRGGSADAHHEKGYFDSERLGVNPAFFRRLDAKIAAINARGLVAAPVALWALTADDPGVALSEANAIRLARYQVARWNAHQVVWLLGGDGKYLKNEAFAERWRRIGRAVLAERRDRLATLHPCGQSWVGAAFRDEPWFDFIGYQSGHDFRKPEALRWLVAGPVAAGWSAAPRKPVVNLESNYEAFFGGAGHKPFGPFEVRRAAYWSLLVTPTAGLTYGHNSIWPWNAEAVVPEGHPRLGVVEPWERGLDAEGVRNMTILRRFFESLPWMRLLPAPGTLVEQPGDRDPSRFIAVARAEQGDCLVAYTPTGATVALRADAAPKGMRARWFDPRKGVWLGAEAAAGREGTFPAPDANDWLLVIAEER
jgi:hypothetical protein